MQAENLLQQKKYISLIYVVLLSEEEEATKTLGHVHHKTSTKGVDFCFRVIIKHSTPDNWKFDIACARTAASSLQFILRDG